MSKFSSPEDRGPRWSVVGISPNPEVLEQYRGQPGFDAQVAREDLEEVPSHPEHNSLETAALITRGRLALAGLTVAGITAGVIAAQRFRR